MGDCVRASPQICGVAAPLAATLTFLLPSKHTAAIEVRLSARTGGAVTVTGVSLLARSPLAPPGAPPDRFPLVDADVVGDVLKDVMIMLLPMFGVLVLVIIWPQVSLFLPGLVSPEFLK